MTDATIPATPDAYQPIVAELEGVPKGVRIDTDHPTYKAAAKAAHAAGLSQHQFSRLLAHEAQRVAAHAKASPPSAPAAAPPPAPDWLKMTTRQKFGAASSRR
jgi:hypothetical protein